MPDQESRGQGRPRRPSRWLFWLGIAVLIVFGIPLLIWAGLGAKWSRDVKRQLAAIHARGEPVTLAEVAPKPVTPDQNAAVLYQQVFLLDFSPTAPSVWPIRSWSKEDNSILTEYARSPTPALDRKVATILNRPTVRRDLGVLRAASQRPHCVFPLRWSDGHAMRVPHLMALYRAASAVDARATMLARQGRTAEALVWYDAALRVSDHVTSEPTLVAQAQGCYMQQATLRSLKAMLPALRVRGSASAALDDTIGSIDLRGSFRQMARADRTLGVSIFDDLNRHDRDVRPLMDLLMVGPRYAEPWFAPLRALDERTYLSLMGAYIRVTDRPYHLAKPWLEKKRWDLEDSSLFLPVSRTLPPMVGLMAETRDRTIADLDLCRIALALKACAYQNHRYPATLAELQKTIKWTIPQDPFSGKDYVYRRQGQGFIVYSLGQNMTDENGLPERDAKGHDRREKSDIVWQCTR